MHDPSSSDPSDELQRLAAENAALNAENAALRQQLAAFERSQAEERSFRALCDNLPYGVGLWSSHGSEPGTLRLEYVNPRASLEWGTEIEGKVGQSLQDALPEALAAEGPYSLPAMWNRVARSGTPEMVDPLPYGPPDRPQGWLRAHAVPAGENRVAMVFDNISRHIRAERQLRQLNNELERRVRERTARLDDLNKELEAFSYTVSHDLRAPLRAIIGFAEALEEDFGETLPEEALQYLHHICEGGLNMRARINGLLTLSRLTRHELLVETVPISERAEKVFSRLQDPTRAATLKVQPGLEVRADPRLVDLLLENLLSNALKFTRDRDSAVIEFGMGRSRGTTAFFVRDNGEGFDNAHASRMFEPFQRLHTQGRFPGTGIGLATVQRIAHSHGGRAWADGEPGVGATFWFTL